MGCGSSNSSPTVVPQPQNGKASKQQNGSPPEKEHINANGFPKQNGTSWSVAEQENITNSVKDEESRTPELTTNTRINSEKEMEKRDLTKEEVQQQTREPKSNTTNEQPVSPTIAAVAFEVSLDDGSHELRKPHKLKKLEKVTTLTADMLVHKQAAAEENRQRELDKKIKRTSRRRKDLVEAREFDKSQHQKAEIEEKVNAIEKNREKAIAEKISKQKRREERARRVRERAKKIQDGEDMVDFAVDCDETYYADDDDKEWDLEHSLPSSASSNSNRHSPNDKREDTDVEESRGQNKNNNNNKEVHDFFE